MNKKYIFITGGVISGLGKGVTAASIGRLLKDSGFKVTNMKIDAYVNIDAGTMNPTEHGEVFVTNDGMETDQDIGNYERFLNTNLSSANYTTTGQIYQSLIAKERNLKFDGKCVEVVPHVPLEIINQINQAAKKNNAEIIIIEIGGTIGEYQNILFLEAARMLKYQNPNDVAIALVSFLPIPKTLGEMKTKPTQYASRTLNETGIQADLLICRGEKMLDKPRMERLAIFCNMANKKDIITAPDVDNIYKVPLILQKQNIIERLTEKLHLPKKRTNLNSWKKIIEKAKRKKPKIKIGIIGKYFNVGDYVLSDAYISIIEAIKHACWKNNVAPKIEWLDSEDYEKDPKKLKELKKYNGIIVPGGYGKRGTEGKIKAIKYVRKNKIPYFGLCYGLQMAIIEFARNVCKLKNANSTEINPKTKYPVIDVMKEQKKILAKKEYGGTNRLGAYPCKIKKGSKTYQAYNQDYIEERHRHRYEVNNNYKDILEKNGLKIVGINPRLNLAEIVELKNHPWFIATQFHPEFKSRPENPHPLFINFIKACSQSSI